MRRITQTILGALALAVPLCISGAAQAASLESCGNIYVEAEAECTVYADVECEAMCTPVTVTAACAAELSASCQGDCNVSASAECTGSCTADCQAECEVKPAEFNCVATCQGRCGADCEGRGAAGDGQAEGRASCEASCSGSCKAEANADCQIDCQADGYVDCKADLQGGCKGHCDDPEGALFCDGQYVDAGDNLAECIAALKAIFNFEIDGYADGSAMCSGNTCTAEGVAGCNCAVDAPGGLPLATLGLAFVVLGATRRRRA